MLQDIGQIFQISITITEIVRNLLVAFLCGMLISFFYKITYHGPGYMNTFVNAMTLLSMITALVIMVIGNNLARAFGLVGAMSIIRFRTAVKETQDILYIFFSLAAGMAAGVGLHFAAITGTVLIGGVSVLLSKSNLIAQSRKEYLLQFNVQSGSKADESIYSDVIEKYCKRSRIVNAKSIGENGDLELSYYVSLKNPKDSSRFINELKNIEGIQHVNLFFDEEFF
ncbi:MAG: DUF4956 domain-containing protein [Calditrichaceae bacterium]|nr:DUF4956 domain-containing protein [Calditrichaceae bacterium]MBN2707770.1 DUF4956 domain-containing protein [Calditrichaceae bacterium]RQV96404.1 MAG: DUF4956 domain-containing protein [Calditrichota bacterium]